MRANEMAWQSRRKNIAFDARFWNFCAFFLNEEKSEFLGKFMQIIQGRVSNLTKETYNQDTNEIVQETENIDDFYLMDRYEFKINDKTFYDERYEQNIENGDEVIVCFDEKDFFVYYMINLTKNWEDTTLENPINKTDVLMALGFILFGMYLAVISSKVVLSLFLVLFAFCVCLIFGFFSYKEYKKHQFFITKMKEMANLKKNL